MNYIGIAPAELKKTAEQLNILLSSYAVFYQNMRYCHWTVHGKSFFTLHEEFENIYKGVQAKIDDLAERLLTLGYQPKHKLSDFVLTTEIKEFDLATDAQTMVNMILNNQTKLIEIMRRVINAASEVNDEGTVDMVASMLADTEKATWLLGSWSRQPEMVL